MSRALGEALATLVETYGPDAVERVVGRLQETRIGESAAGQAALAATHALVDEYGDDALRWLIATIRAHRQRKVQAAAADATANVDAAYARIIERLTPKDPP